MEIARLQPFPLTFEQDGFDADTDYVLVMMNDYAQDLVEIPVTSDGAGVVSTPLPDFFSRYDDYYRAEIYLSDGTNPDLTPILGDLVWIDTVTINRPYVDPASLAESEDDIEQIRQYEELARYIIDSITGGFGYKRSLFETTGTGADYLYVPHRLNKIIRVVENDILVYDSESDDPDWTNTREYAITADKTAITVSMPSQGGLNRRQSRSPWRVTGSSDSFTTYNTNDSPTMTEAVYDTKTFIDVVGNSSMFPVGWDYTIVVDTGWPVIPSDIKRATTMLINDLKCGGNPYLNTYMKDYKTDQYEVKFDPKAFEGTGNRIVDKILSTYPRMPYRLGVL